MKQKEMNMKEYEMCGMLIFQYWFRKLIT